MSLGYSHAQLLDMLSPTEGQRIYALIDGRRIPGIVDKLPSAKGVAGWDKLARSAPSPLERERTGYLVEMMAADEFGEWLLGQITEQIPNWGMVLGTNADLISVRDHCRDLMEVLLPGGERRRWRWYDPELFSELAPHWGSDQLDQFFSVFDCMVLPATKAWTWYVRKDDALTIDVRTLLERS